MPGVKPGIVINISTAKSRRYHYSLIISVNTAATSSALGLLK